MSVFAAVGAELDIWQAEGLEPRFWLRDDDATAPDPRLDRLIALVRPFDVPLLLAVIPAHATASLAQRLADEPLVTPCVHGFAHRNHMPDGEKAVELGGRSIEEVLSELRQGRQRLLDLFPARLSGILVPPWNRIDRNVAAHVHECGFTAVSSSSWQKTGTVLPELNTQVDIMNWEGGRIGHELAFMVPELLRRLQEARMRGGAPIGMLSHHLVHDAAAWATLEGLLSYLQVERGLSFKPADRLVGQLVNDTDPLRP